MSIENKPAAREFWIEFTIDPDKSNHHIADIFTIKPTRPYQNVIHTIEYSAYQSALDRIAEKDKDMQTSFKRFDDVASANLVLRMRIAELEGTIRSYSLDPGEVMSRGLHESRMKQSEKRITELEKILCAPANIAVRELVEENERLREVLNGK